MVLISSLYLFQDARSWPDKVHDAWMLLGLALAGPWPGPWLALGLALAGPWPGPGWPLAWPLAGSWPGPWLALGLALARPWPGPWRALGLALGWPGCSLNLLVLKIKESNKRESAIYIRKVRHEMPDTSAGRWQLQIRNTRIPEYWY